MPRPFPIFSQSDYLIQVVDINSNTRWQTVQIQISWLLQKPTDLDLHCLQRQGISGFSRTRVNLTTSWSYQCFEKFDFLMLSMLGKNFRQQFEMFFFLFFSPPKKTDFTSSCKLSPQKKNCMKVKAYYLHESQACFLGKIKIFQIVCCWICLESGKS